MFLDPKGALAVQTDSDKAIMTRKIKGRITIRMMFDAKRKELTDKLSSVNIL